MLQKKTKREGEKRLFARNFKATYAPPHTTTNHPLRNDKIDSCFFQLKSTGFEVYEALGKTITSSSSLSPHGIIGSVFEFLENETSLWTSFVL
ncbi:hypothetical protein F2Q69_00033096 [Brassica cretica]|uniref:Uncharacterized protein n=1 Tax=Brassica cretica TaxID=69181 RepID=A0A8S9SUV8_BRACR|nr:hypothetical protein F2Q69_00033096 [Brassica cretica]